MVGYVQAILENSKHRDSAVKDVAMRQIKVLKERQVRLRNVAV